MAAERSLRRLITRYGFPFSAIGPESDYYGLVSPYVMDLREFDTVIASGRIPDPDGVPRWPGARVLAARCHRRRRCALMTPTAL